MIKSEIKRNLDLDPCANANENYEILSKIKGNTKKDKWMTDNLLSLVNQKNDMYSDWK